MIKLEVGKVGELGGGSKQETQIVINISKLEEMCQIDLKYFEFCFLLTSSTR